MASRKGNLGIKIHLRCFDRERTRTGSNFRGKNKKKILTLIR
jgi:hypothetical protein